MAPALPALLIALSLTEVAAAAAAAAAGPANLLLNHEAAGRLLHHPAADPPRFSWSPPHRARCGSRQVAYQLRIRDAVGSTVLDTGRVLEPASVNVFLPAAAQQDSASLLQPGRQYRWAVKVWLTDAQQQASSASSTAGACVSESGWSETAQLRTALWGRFSAAVEPITLPNAAYALYRREYELPAVAVKAATCFVTALVSGLGTRHFPAM
jgi:hypothetical protein